MICSCIFVREFGNPDILVACYYIFGKSKLNAKKRTKCVHTGVAGQLTCYAGTSNRQGSNAAGGKCTVSTGACIKSTQTVGGRV